MTDTYTETVAAGRNAPSLGTLFHVFLKIGLLSFGGPAAQIALMHRLLVEELKWLTEQQYLNALSFCMLLPGPEAMQIATYAGWRLRGIAGGLIGGLLFVIPGAVLILVLAAIYALFGQLPLIDSLFLGVKSAVLLIVVEALLRVSKRALRGRADWVVAGLAFAGIFILDLPYPLIVAAAALWGWAASSAVSTSDNISAPISRSFGGTMLTITIGLTIWWLPVLLVAQLSGFPVLTHLGLFFSKLAVVTFGGAYAVLAYMAQDVVGTFGWLNAGEMMDGLGLAETTPGPLILVTEFVGFLAAYRDGGIVLGIAGAALTLWVTFVPCFLWIFAGAPYIDWISAQPRLKGALSSITAAVVGVILNLSLWFGLHVMFGAITRQDIGPFTLWQPDLATFDWRVAVLAALSGLLLLKLHWGIGRVLAICAGLSWLMVNSL
ncbi:chromate efflux transporter [Nisaea sp.]|uniref:chromate efflux transporter n=1 Tax=Nisaea sp. TaxID=2024842 RepID=UPI00326449E5